MGDLPQNSESFESWVLIHFFGWEVLCFSNKAIQAMPGTQSTPALRIRYLVLPEW